MYDFVLVENLAPVIQNIFCYLFVLVEIVSVFSSRNC